MRDLTPAAECFFREQKHVRLPPGWRRRTDGISTATSNPVFLPEAIQAAVEESRHNRSAKEEDARIPQQAPLRLQREPETFCKGLELFDHQREFLRAFVHDGALHSGLAISPCGSGKTVCGLLLANILQEAGSTTLVVTRNDIESKQWHDAACKYGATNAVVLHSKSQLTWQQQQPRLIITTYRALADACTCSVQDWVERGKCLALLLAANTYRYGLVIFDEVWTLLANTHFQACRQIECKVRVGLSADLRRADGRNESGDLEKFIGPLLFNMSVSTGVERGVICAVHSEVVRIDGGAEFNELYGAAASMEDQRLISILAPAKMRTLHELLRTSRAAKAIIFVDRIAAIEHVEVFLKNAAIDQPFIGTLTGQTPHSERLNICRALRSVDRGIALFSQVGNVGVDVPDVELVVELSVVTCAAQPKVQRDGRGQRAAAKKAAARVVTLLMKHTHEEELATRREGQTEWRDEPAQDDTACCPWTHTDLQNMVGRLPKRRRIDKNNV